MSSDETCKAHYLRLATFLLAFGLAGMVFGYIFKPEPGRIFSMHDMRVFQIGGWVMIAVGVLLVLFLRYRKECLLACLKDEEEYRGLP